MTPISQPGECFTLEFLNLHSFQFVSLSLNCANSLGINADSFTTLNLLL